MPDGSSSAAPVIRPGPNSLRTATPASRRARLFLDCDVIMREFQEPEAGMEAYYHGTHLHFGGLHENRPFCAFGALHSALRPGAGRRPGQVIHRLPAPEHGVGVEGGGQQNLDRHRQGTKGLQGLAQAGLFRPQMADASGLQELWRLRPVMPSAQRLCGGAAPGRYDGAALPDLGCRGLCAAKVAKRYSAATPMARRISRVVTVRALRSFSTRAKSSA